MPGKEAWLALENDEELEFEFFLTQKLGLGTVANMRRVMTQTEFLYWSRYYVRRAQEQELEQAKAGG